MKNPIGIFDSGVGGLTVVKEFKQQLPNENIIYFGDIARVPYGGKTPDEIVNIVREIIDWMLGYNVKAIAMACNTSSALALSIVQQEYNIPIFGLIKPTANYINKLETKPERIGVISTKATANSHSYANEIQNLSPEIEVYEMGCPGLVEIVESGQVNSMLAYREVKKYIDPLVAQKVEKIILGCTHYPFLSGVISDIYPKEDLLINPAKYMAKEVQFGLEKLGLVNNFNPSPSADYYVSAHPRCFIDTATKFMPGELDATNVHLVNTATTKVPDSLAV